MSKEHWSKVNYGWPWFRASWEALGLVLGVKYLPKALDF
ncbi:hypothetical protein Tco_1488303, partial [Tanacetum coccineum]